MRKISNNFIRLYQLNPIFNLLTDISSIIDQILKFSHLGPSQAQESVTLGLHYSIELIQIVSEVRLIINQWRLIKSIGAIDKKGTERRQLDQY